MVVRKGSADCDLRDPTSVQGVARQEVLRGNAPRNQNHDCEATATPRWILRKRLARRPKTAPHKLKKSSRRWSSTTAEATALIKDSYSTAIKGAQEYNTRFIEFAQNNTKAAFDFIQRLLGH